MDSQICTGVSEGVADGSPAIAVGEAGVGLGGLVAVAAWSARAKREGSGMEAITSAADSSARRDRQSPSRRITCDLAGRRPLGRRRWEFMPRKDTPIAGPPVKGERQSRQTAMRRARAGSRFTTHARLGCPQSPPAASTDYLSTIIFRVRVTPPALRR